MHPRFISQISASPALNWAMLLSLALSALILTACGSSTQPDSGPGGRSYPHSGVQVTPGGSGDNAWFVFEPTNPKPASAPLVIITHGYDEYEGYEMHRALIEHTVRKGNVVIYPRWQTGLLQPCPGPANIEPCMASEITGIRGGLAYLKADSTRVQPQFDRTSYFGFSFGGIITANMLNRWQSLGLPEPKAVFLDDPHDGGFTGNREPALDASLAGIPSSTLFVCHSGAHGVFDDAYTGAPNNLDELGQPKKDGSCNQVFPRLTSIPVARKSLVLTSEDTHGQPALTSDHGVCGGPRGGALSVDVYDWGFCWRTFDALRSCAYEGKDCEYALGDTPQNRYIGTWSDGTPIIGLKIQTTAPIRAEPVPARAPAPH